MDAPETRYARSGDVRIAYQVTGSGPLDLVFVPGFVSNLDLWCGIADLVEFLRAAGELFLGVDPVR